MNTGKKEPSMATKLNHEQKGILDDQLFALRDKTVNGVRDFDEVRKALQRIIEGKFFEKTPTPVVVSSVPSWYVSPERQLERVIQLNKEQRWGLSMADVRPIPEFTSRTETEVLLLTISLPTVGRKSGLHRTFDELWSLIEAPDGYTKYRLDELKATTKLLRQAPGYNHTPGIRWVVFDPNAYHSKSPEAALKQSKIDNAQLAGFEVLMATLLFPTWATSWNGDSSPYPNMSALQFYWNSDWSIVPYLGRWDGNRQLGLSASWAGYSNGSWSSPSVREC
jgi:hypothetical protein